MAINAAEVPDLVERMPAFPQGVTKVLDLASRPDCAPKALVQVIEHDPVMTMKVLKLVNSAYFGLSRPINSINHGVVYVGINTIKNLALSIAAIGMLPKSNKAGLDMNQFLAHSLGVASVAKLLATHLGVPDKDATDFFVAGLLHDFGKVVLAQFKPEEFRLCLDQAAEQQRSLHEVELESQGISHDEIGGRLAEVWKLPPALAHAIHHHHYPEQAAGDAGDGMCEAVFAANQIVRSLGFGDAGNPLIAEFPPLVSERFGNDLSGLMSVLGDLSGEMEKARLFTQL
ncbi:MAG: HDOD domain-containing protein [Candidatus Thiodiazotropha taylori]